MDRRKKITCRRVLCVAALAAVFLGARGQAQTIPNPVLPGVADAGVMKYNGKYYLGGVFTDGGLYVSDDLVHWQGPWQALTMNNDWTRGTGAGNDQIHANDLVYLDGEFHFYWSVNYWGNDRHAVHIAHARADSVLGPYAEPDRSAWLDNRIDPMVFRDDDGRLYMYMVRFTDGNTIWGRPMKNPAEFAGPPVCQFASLPDTWETMDNRVAEGPWVMKYRGRYYMMYNANHTSTEWGNYQLGVAEADRPLGFGHGGKYSYPVAGSNQARLEEESADWLRYGAAGYDPFFAYTFDSPAGGWQTAGYDDGAWARGAAGFASEAVKGSTTRPQGTVWTTPALWLRKRFDVPGERLEALRGVLAAEALAAEGAERDISGGPVSAGAAGGSSVRSGSVSAGADGSHAHSGPVSADAVSPGILGKAEKLLLRVAHDGDTRIYLNGRLVYEKQGAGYGLTRLSAEDAAALRADGNLLAAETRAGRKCFFDVALFDAPADTDEDILMTPGQPNIVRGPNGFEWWLVYMANKNRDRRGQYINRVHFWGKTLYVDGPTAGGTSGYHALPSLPTLGDTFEDARTLGETLSPACLGSVFQTSSGQVSRPSAGPVSGVSSSGVSEASSMLSGISDTSGSSGRRVSGTSSGTPSGLSSAASSSKWKVYADAKANWEIASGELRKKGEGPGAVLAGSVQPAVSYLFEAGVKADADAGVIAWWKDKAHWAKAGLDAARGCWYLTTCAEGREETRSYPLAPDFRFGVYHSWRIERNGEALQVSLDNLPAPGQSYFPALLPASAPGLPGLFATSGEAAFDGVAYTVGFDDYDDRMPAWEVARGAYVRGAWGEGAFASSAVPLAASSGTSSFASSGLSAAGGSSSGDTSGGTSGVSSGSSPSASVAGLVPASVSASPAFSGLVTVADSFEAFKGDRLDRYEFDFQLSGLPGASEASFGGVAGCYPLYVDAGNYVKAVFNAATRSLDVAVVKEGRQATKRSFPLDRLQTLYPDVKYTDFIEKTYIPSAPVFVDALYLSRHEAGRPSEFADRMFDCFKVEYFRQGAWHCLDVSRQDVADHPAYNRLTFAPVRAEKIRLVNKRPRDLERHSYRLRLHALWKEQYHFRAVREKDRLYLFVDGVEIATFPVDYPASRIGLWAEGCRPAYNGILYYHRGGPGTQPVSGGRP